MNPLYEKAKDVVLIRRTSDNKEFEEYPLILQPQSALVTDPANDILCFGLCGLRVGFATSASYSDTSSFAWYALSASFANSASYCLSSSNAISASYAITSSLALEASSAFSAAYARLASMSLAVRGLNVVNVPPMPNGDIVWPVDDNTPAIYDAIATIGPSPAEGQTHALIRIPDNNKIYGGGWYGTIYVFNDPDNDFTNITSCSFNPGKFISQMVYASGSIYVLNGSSVGPSTGSITRVNINNITSQSVIVQGLPGSTLLAGLATDGNSLFTIIASQIRKYDLSGSLVQAVAAVSASATISSCHGGTISTDKQWAFFSTTNGAIFKVKCSDITNYTASRRQQSIFPSGPFDASLTDDICYLDGYVYSAVESNGNMFKMNADDMTYTAYPVSGNSYGVFTDNAHIYLLVGNEIWVYLNGDTDSGPIRFGVTGVANELAITNGGRFVYSNWTTLNLYSYFFPITQLGINKQPSYALDVAGTINAGSVIAPYISASSYIETNGIITGDVDLYGTLTLDGTNIIRSSTSNALRISSGSVRVATLSSSAALLGRADNTHFSQSFTTGISMSYTRSLGTIAQDGMYRLTVAGTMGFYGGTTLQNQPKWQFLHRDRMGTYALPQTPLTPITLTTPANYEYAFSFGSDYIFQAVAGSAVEYYYHTNGTAVSSTDCSASFFTTTTLAQILSGSVTGSI